MKPDTYTATLRALLARGWTYSQAKVLAAQAVKN